MSGAIIVDASLSISFNVYRPYQRSAAETRNASILPAPEKSAVPGADSEPVPSLNIETPPNDGAVSDDGIVLLKSLAPNEDSETVKRRWFHEEVRQSPVFSVTVNLMSGT